ncbi:hypothetical protein AB833_11865 [Chromatiales bacterium (ex Bugula neritina AB1)]|nr:hypothetical protein AB833_11865 [Chromatiales bacterium (ex Bugula neritina AB1)]
MRISKGLGNLFALNFDGAVANVGLLVLNRLNSVLEHHNHAAIDLPCLDRLWGLSLVELIQRAANCPAADAAHMADRYLSAGEPSGVPRCDETIQEIVSYLTVRPAQLACISLYLPHVAGLIGQLPVESCFDYIDNSNDSRESQINRLLQQTESTNIWLISDRVADIKIGRELGIGTVAVTWGHDDEWDMAVHSPDYIIEDIAEVMGFISTQMMDLPASCPRAQRCQ